VDQPELSLRHTLQLFKNHEISWGIELADRKTDSFFFQELPLPNTFTADYEFSEESTDFYASDRFRVSDQLTLQADLYLSEHERSANYIDSITGLPAVTTNETFTKDGVFPRLGLVYRFSPNQLVRLAYQEWIRPSGFSSLGQVATAGIPLDDRLVMRGGELNRLRGQIEWEWSAKTFTQVYLDFKEIDNDLFDAIPFTVNELDDLVKLRQRDLGSLVRGDLLEFVSTPEYEGADIFNFGISINHRLGGGLGLFGRYIYTDSENNGTVNRGNLVPYLPEHTNALGATWTSPDGWYFVTRFVYRSERFSDAANLTPLEASWDGAVDLYKESPDKHLLFRFSVDNMVDRNQHAQYTVEVSARF
jgi:outer membrane receptor protein involved in Fe transport